MFLQCFFKLFAVGAVTQANHVGRKIFLFKLTQGVNYFENAFFLDKPSYEKQVVLFVFYAEIILGDFFVIFGILVNDKVCAVGNNFDASFVAVLSHKVDAKIVERPYDVGFFKHRHYCFEHNRRQCL